MKTLHWHTDDNPCLLCGVPVTPEAWVGGVIESLDRDCKPDGQWWTVEDYYGERQDYGEEFVTRHRWNERCDQFRPIFPPKGWQNATDYELLCAMCPQFKGNYEVEMFSGEYWSVGIYGDGEPLVKAGSIERGIEYHQCELAWEKITDLPILSLALSNIAILSARLGVRDAV